MQTTLLPPISFSSAESEPQCEGAIRFAPGKLCHDGPERGLVWGLARLLCPPVPVAQALAVREVCVGGGGGGGGRTILKREVRMGPWPPAVA